MLVRIFFAVGEFGWKGEQETTACNAEQQRCHQYLHGASHSFDALDRMSCVMYSAVSVSEFPKIKNLQILAVRVDS